MIITKQGVTLCCGAKGCPDMKLTEDGKRVKIRFDDGAEGEMLISQAQLIAPALQHLTQDFSIKRGKKQGS